MRAQNQTNPADLPATLVAHDEQQLSDPTYLPKLLREHLVEGIIDNSTAHNSDVYGRNVAAKVRSQGAICGRLSTSQAMIPVVAAKC
jgi:hypothetical protein